MQIYSVKKKRDDGAGYTHAKRVVSGEEITPFSQLTFGKRSIKKRDWISEEAGKKVPKP